LRHRFALAAGLGAAPEPDLDAALCQPVLSRGGAVAPLAEHQGHPMPRKVIRRRGREKIHASLLTADLAFDVNLPLLLKRGGEAAQYLKSHEWTDKVGSK